MQVDDEERLGLRIKLSSAQGDLAEKDDLKSSLKTELNSPRKELPSTTAVSDINLSLITRRHHGLHILLPSASQEWTSCGLAVVYSDVCRSFN